VKLVVEEPESGALRAHLGPEPDLVVSRIAVVEVSRAVRVASPGPEANADAERLLSRCTLVDVTESILRNAVGLASAHLRTLDAIHLASALRAAPDELVSYDARVLEAAAAAGIAARAPLAK
jgi:uncharacterized protein